MRIKILGCEARAAFEPDHLHPGPGELGRENAAGGADTDNDDVRLFRCHGSSSPDRGLRLQADDGRA